MLFHPFLDSSPASPYKVGFSLSGTLRIPRVSLKLLLLSSWRVCLQRIILMYPPATSITSLLWILQCTLCPSRTLTLLKRPLASEPPVRNHLPIFHHPFLFSYIVKPSAADEVALYLSPGLELLYVGIECNTCNNGDGLVQVFNVSAPFSPRYVGNMTTFTLKSMFLSSNIVV
jgi:hypothetical protein